ncbi:MAG: hypothetical protein AB7V45_12790 [Candidatus Krumholzibacteriia bacterium]
MRFRDLAFLPAALFAAALVLTACSGPDSTDHPQQTTAEESIPGLSLDDGAKWVMDDHTRTQFAAMTARMERGGDVRTVGAGLQEDLDKLIQGCRMTGKGHDQLHMFLVSYMPAVRGMAEDGSEESREKASELLRLYPRYFE